MGCEIKTLGNLCVGGGQYGIAAPAVDFSSDLPTYLRITDIRDDGTLSTSERKSVDNPAAERYILKEGDIVFARTGTSVGRNYFYDSRDGSFAYAGFLIKFSLDSHKVNPRYVKYFVQTKAYWDWVESVNSGSTRGNINAKTFASLPIPIPSRSEQDRIVQVCDVLNDKIRVNRRINDYLAAQEPRPSRRQSLLT